MKIIDGKVHDCTINISAGTKVPDSDGVQTMSNFTVDFEDCPVEMLLDWVRKSWWIDDQKVLRKMDPNDIHALNGTVVPYTHAKTRFNKVSDAQGLAVTTRSYRSLIAEGKFAEAQKLLFEVTGDESLYIAEDGSIGRLDDDEE